MFLKQVMSEIYIPVCDGKIAHFKCDEKLQVAREHIHGHKICCYNVTCPLGASKYLKAPKLIK